MHDWLRKLRAKDDPDIAHLLQTHPDLKVHILHAKDLSDKMEPLESVEEQLFKLGGFDSSQAPLVCDPDTLHMWCHKRLEETEERGENSLEWWSYIQNLNTLNSYRRELSESSRQMQQAIDSPGQRSSSDHTPVSSPPVGLSWVLRLCIALIM